MIEGNITQSPGKIGNNVVMIGNSWSGLEQVVVSTGTKNLQDQLYKRDLPALLKILEISPPTAV